jgi:hypothetical protein
MGCLPKTNPRPPFLDVSNRLFIPYGSLRFFLRSTIIGMYRSYNQCGFRPVNNVRSIPYTPPVVTNVAAVPESVRMAAEVCPTMFVTTNVSEVTGTNSTICMTPSNNQKLSIPTIPGAPISYVTVGTVPASVSVQMRAQAAVLQTSDPFNTANRFAQYFPPAPIPYCPPVRGPNTDPRPSVNVCLPIQRFTGIPNN